MKSGAALVLVLAAPCWAAENPEVGVCLAAVAGKEKDAARRRQGWGELIYWARFLYRSAVDPLAEACRRDLVAAAKEMELLHEPNRLSTFRSGMEALASVSRERAESICSSTPMGSIRASCYVAIANQEWRRSWRGFRSHRPARAPTTTGTSEIWPWPRSEWGAPPWRKR